MAEPQPELASKLGGRRRNRRKDDDEDEDNNNNNVEVNNVVGGTVSSSQQQQELSPSGIASPPPPPPPAAAAAAAPVAPLARPVAPKARAAAAAPAALHHLHADPSSPTLDGSAQRSASSGDDASAVMTADGVFALDFDKLTYSALCDVMSQVPVQRIVEKMAAREREAQAALQQQSQRIERFLDVAPLLASSTAGSSSSSSNVNGGNANGDAASSSGYTYTMMLTRLFEALNLNNEGGAMKERNQLPVPVIDKIGKKKTVISNFDRICSIFHRPVEDVKDFIEKELSTRGNLDSNNALILKFEIRRATDFDNILIKYLDEFVKCNSCHRIDTTLTKDGRRTELRCNWCTATRTVQAVGSATFSAQIEKRSRQRAAMTL